MMNTMAITRETYEKSHDFFACFRLVYDVNKQFGIKESREKFMSRVLEIWNNPEAYQEAEAFLEK